MVKILHLCKYVRGAVELKGDDPVAGVLPDPPSCPTTKNKVPNHLTEKKNPALHPGGPTIGQSRSQVVRGG